MTAAARLRWSTRIPSGSALILALFALILAGAFVTPYDPNEIAPLERLQAPSAAHLLGTDQYGRDVLSRLLAGGRLSLLVALAATLIALFVGAVLGGFSAYRGGWLDRAVAVVVDATMAFPGILLALTLMIALEPGPLAVILALAIAFTPTVVRVTRATVLSLRTREFVEASALLGLGPARIFVRHVLPNCVTPLTVLGSSVFALALLTESALSFLGVGVPPPSSTWGGMLADSRPFLAVAPWLGWVPGLAISAVLLGANLFGDSLRDRLDPRLQASA